MKTPIVDFVEHYKKSGVLRFHMPGHKGKRLIGCEENDITEISGADVLYSAGGIISESQKNAAELFGSAATFYSAEGSTLAIKAMLALVCENVFGRRPRVLAGRNAHKAFVYGCALLDIDADWIYGESADICECNITPEMLEKRLADYKSLPDAVFLTSPDYLGNELDIKRIAEVCDNFNIPLLVDNAHGAYLRFLESNRHPINLGAAMCCDSAHKTLPVLTGGAYLHISEKGREYIDSAERCLSIFASTSPSYLILQSLDMCNKQLSFGYASKIQKCAKRLDALKEELRLNGFSFIGSEPLKLTVNAKAIGYSGMQLAEILRSRKIECEFSDENYVVFMFTPNNSQKDFAVLKKALLGVEKRPAKSTENVILKPSQRVITIREAVLSKSETVSIENAIGRVCATPTVSCPPAVPIVVSGEEITKNSVEIFKLHGIEKADVVKGAY